MKKVAVFIFAIIFLSTFSLMGCENKKEGSLEEMGKKMDKKIEETQKKLER